MRACGKKKDVQEASGLEGTCIAERDSWGRDGAQEGMRNTGRLDLKPERWRSVKTGNKIRKQGSWSWDTMQKLRPALP